VSVASWLALACHPCWIRRDTSIRRPFPAGLSHAAASRLIMEYRLAVLAMFKDLLLNSEVLQAKSLRSPRQNFRCAFKLWLRL
jgi:hypothetical protein